MPQLLRMIQVDHLTPAPAVITMCLLSLVYLTTKNIYALINYVGFATWLAIGTAVVCVPYLRYTRPELERPIKVHLFWPYLYIVCTLFIVIVPCIADPYGTGMGLIIIASGVPVYFIFIGWKNKPMWFQRGSSKYWIDACIINSNVQLFFIQPDAATAFLQKLLVVIPADKPDKV